MLFSSFVFIFAFLPFALVTFYGLRRLGRTASMWVLALASLGFYAWWNPSQTWVLLVSIIANFVAGYYIQVFRETKPAIARAILWGGLTLDLGALVYFKYTMFLVHNLNRYGGADFVVPHIILPLGISFFTFQKIAYLVDCARGEARKTTVGEFAL